MSKSSKSKVIVLTALQEGISITAVAKRFSVSPRWVHFLLARYREAGLDALEPKSTAAKSHPHAISDELKGEIIRLRSELGRQGLDNGAETIAWHLEQADLAVPAASTIWRILRQAGLVTPQPRKKPKAYLQRFVAHQPNETWQSDFTHWRLEDGTDVEILNWLDDH